MTGFVLIFFGLGLVYTSGYLSAVSDTEGLTEDRSIMYRAIASLCGVSGSAMIVFICKELLIV